LTDLIRKLSLCLLGIFLSVVGYSNNANSNHKLTIVSSQHFTRNQPPDSTLIKLQRTSNQFFGEITGEVWLYASVYIQNTGNYTLEVPNASIDTVQIFQIDSNQQLRQILLGGDHIPVSKQIGGIQSPFIHLPLNPGVHYFLIKYIQKGRFIHPLFWIYPITQFQNKKTTQLLFNGLFIGFCTFLLLLSSVLGLYLRKRIFLYYAIWTVLQLAYFLLSLGYFRYWFYPENITINSSLRAFTSAIIPILFALVILEYLDENKSLGVIKRVLHGLTLLSIGIFVIERSFTEYFWQNIRPWIAFVAVISIIGTLISAFIILFYARNSWKKPLFVGISFSLHLIITVLLIWFESEPWAFDFIELYTFTGFLPIFELITLGILIGWKMTQTISYNQQLLKENLQLQTHSQEMHANTVEEERKRIAMELHDTSLNRISILSMLLTSNQIDNSKASEEISIIGNEIRATAYSLYPPWLDALNFKEVILRELEHAKQNSHITINYKFYDWKTEPTQYQKRHIVRIIQEFIQNTLKHADATQIDLHFFERDNQFYIELEDNGIGFKPENTEAGLGRLSVETRVKLLQGTITISSSPGQGVNWLIEIPI
jgi:signal transduction histidine kinase